jgi:hypothetical protein
MPIDAPHLHLILTHVPVIGVPFLLLLLTIGLARKSSEVVTIALVLTVGVAAATGGVYLTGEPAEEALEHTAWFSEQLTDTHEDLAAVALGVTLATGALAVVALVYRRGGRWLTRLAWFGLLVSTLILGWTAWSGGQIRHDEIRSPVAGRSPGP